MLSVLFSLVTVFGGGSPHADNPERVVAVCPLTTIAQPVVVCPLHGGHEQIPPSPDAWVAGIFGRTRVRLRGRMPQDKRDFRRGRGNEPRFFGHPVALRVFSLTECWERWSFYGMKALLALFLGSMPAIMGGFGFSKEMAGTIVMIYASLVYLMTIVGGWFADNLLGNWLAVAIGAVLIMCGHLTLLFHSVIPFFLGLLLIVIGTGLLKGNISRMVGGMYDEKHQKAENESAFLIFYTFINVGAFVGPLVSGWFVPGAPAKPGASLEEIAKAEADFSYLQTMGWSPSTLWHLAFGTAALFMFVGVVQYLLGSRHVKPFDQLPTPERKEAGIRTLKKAIVSAVLVLGTLAALMWTDVLGSDKGTFVNLFGLAYILLITSVATWLYRRPWSKEERTNLGLVAVLFVGSMLFFACFDQAASTLNQIADLFTDRSIGGKTLSPTYFQSINPIFVIVMGPLVARFWMRLAKQKKNPTYPAKFALGLLGAALGCFAMFWGLTFAVGGGLISPWWLTITFFIHTLGELCLSPIGLSAMTLLAPKSIKSFMMGVWFLSISAGNFLGGFIVKFASRSTEPDALDPRHELSESAFASLQNAVTLENFKNIMLTCGVFAIVVCVIMFFLIGPMKRRQEALEESSAAV